MLPNRMHQQCLACIQIPAPEISYARVKRSHVMGVLLSWERLNLLLSGNVCWLILLCCSCPGHKGYKYVTQANINLQKQLSCELLFRIKVIPW